MKLEGNYTALITPFVGADAERVDYQSLDRLITWQVESGISGFVVCGTSAEAATLDYDERKGVIKFVVERVKGSLPIIVGTGTNCTKSTVELTAQAAELKADASLVVCPYYNKPTQEGLLAHFKRVSAVGGLPIVLYNIPSRSVVDMSYKTLQALSEDTNIVGIKEASGCAHRLLQLSALCGDNFSVLSGDDPLIYTSMTMGGSGAISASSNVMPAQISSVVSRALSGDMAGSLEAQLGSLEKIEALFLETNPAPAKAVLKSMGIIESDLLRLPLVGVCEKTRAILCDLFPNS